MRNGADDTMMAAAGVAVTTASCANAAADSFIGAAASLADEPISGFSKFMIFLSVPVGILVGIIMYKYGFGPGGVVGGFFGGFLGWGVTAGVCSKRING